MGTIEQKLNYLMDTKEAIRQAINAKGGALTTLDPFRSYADSILELKGSGGGGGGSSAQEDADVRFFDYDGTLLYSYSADEFMDVSEFPLPAAQHSELTFAEWNLSIEDARALVARDGICDISATYESTDGKTRIYIELTDPTKLSAFVVFGQSKSKGVLVDWGDGETSLKTATAVGTLTHHYSGVGNYCITLLPDDDCTISFGKSNYSIMATDTSGYYYNSCIKKIVLGKNISNIGDYAFPYCCSLQTIVLPNGITSIGNYAFNNCSNLKWASIPNGVTKLSTYAFSGCNLKGVTIPSSITSLSNNAFQNCALTRVQVLNTLTSVGSSAFRQCFQLVKLLFPDSVTSFGQYFCSECRCLADMPIPKSTTYFGKCAFQNCHSLRSIVIPGTVTTWDTYVFSGCTSLTSVYIEEGLTTIGNYAFQNCESLVSITLPSTLTTLGTYMFEGCLALESVAIPSGVTAIPANCFSGCKSLKYVTMGGSIASVAGYAFTNCTGFEILDFRNNTAVPTLANKNAFSSAPTTLQIVVPDSLYDEWIAATNWSDSSIVSKIVKASDYNG